MEKCIANLEAEHSTLENPDRVKANLAKARERGRICLFDVAEGNEERLGDVLADEGATTGSSRSPTSAGCGTMTDLHPHEAAILDALDNGAGDVREMNERVAVPRRWVDYLLVERNRSLADRGRVTVERPGEGRVRVGGERSHADRGRRESTGRG